MMCLKYCCMYGKQCRPWSDAEYCSIWSGSTLFAKAYLSQYLGLLRYIGRVKQDDDDDLVFYIPFNII